MKRGSSQPHSGNRYNVVALSHQPSKHQLTRRAALLAGEFLELGDDLHVVVKHVLLQTRQRASEVTFLEVGRLELAGEETCRSLLNT